MTLQVRRKGTTTWGFSATIAAGGLSSDVHNADIEVSTTPAMPSGTTVTFTIGIKSGEGRGASGTGGAASLSVGSYVADSNGKIIGTYKSSNKIETVTIECQDANQDTISGSGSATIHQRWDENADDGWDFDEVFVEDEWAPISFTIKTPDSIPIDGHEISMNPTEVYVDVFDYINFGWVAYPDAITEENVASIFGAEASLGNFVEFGANETTDDSGSVSIDQKIYSSPLGYIDVAVSEVYFDAQDETIYK